eukprot:3293166-Rhodomonas_salina.2
MGPAAEGFREEFKRGACGETRRRERRKRREKERSETLACVARGRGGIAIVVVIVIAAGSDVGTAKLIAAKAVQSNVRADDPTAQESRGRCKGAWQPAVGGRRCRVRSDAVPVSHCARVSCRCSACRSMLSMLVTMLVVPVCAAHRSISLRLALFAQSGHAVGAMGPRGVLHVHHAIAPNASSFPTQNTYIYVLLCFSTFFWGACGGGHFQQNGTNH